MEPAKKADIWLGISACLLGQQVRYDGGHKRDPFIVDQLGRHFSFLPICPETAIGMSVPRPPIRLTGPVEQPRAQGVSDPQLDVTERLEDFSRTRVAELGHISGYILKKDSPSCGMERVKVYGDTGAPPVRRGSGIFARQLMAHYPWLPVEEEGRLRDPILRENFINRIYRYREWQELLAEGLTPAALIAFHTRQKYLLMAHSQEAYKRMGRLLANLRKKDINLIADDYFNELMKALQRRVNRKRHANVLQHIMGYLKRNIEGDDKAELLAGIQAYRRGEIPLVVPVTLLKHYFRKHPDPYMTRQCYLQPHPADLGLRNHL